MSKYKLKVYDTDRDTEFFINLEDKEYGIRRNIDDKRDYKTLINKALKDNRDLLKTIGIKPAVSEV